MTSLQSNLYLSRECFKDWVDASLGTRLTFLCWKVKHIRPGSGPVYSNPALTLRLEHADGHQNNEGPERNAEEQPVKHRVTLNNGCVSEIKATRAGTLLFGLELV